MSEVYVVVIDDMVEGVWSSRPDAERNMEWLCSAYEPLHRERHFSLFKNHLGQAILASVRATNLDEEVRIRLKPPEMLRYLMSYKSVSPEQLANETGIAEAVVLGVMRGRAEMSIDVREKIAGYFRVREEMFL